LTSKDFASSKELFNPKMIKDAFENISGALTIVYPQGLPEWDPVRQALDDREDLSGSAASKQTIQSYEATLWWANKELLREKFLSDYVGKNDKTKIIVKLQKVAVINSAWFWSSCSGNAAF
jgi:cilia- and flagella-associated protein 298